MYEVTMFVIYIQLEEVLVMIHTTANAFFDEMGFSLTYRVGAMLDVRFRLPS